jgi:hypothetical protein
MSKKIINKTLLMALLALAILAPVSKAEIKKAPQKKATRDEKPRPLNERTQARNDLIKATDEYKASLEKLVELYENNLKTVKEQLEKHKELFAAGIISKRELEASETRVAEIQKTIGESKKQMAEANDVIAEADAIDDLPAATGKIKIPAFTTTAAYMKFSGTAQWALTDAAKVSSFFSGRFGHSLPISAYGQTGTHDRLGFDHRNSVDVAVHPDGAEGQALIGYLKSAGIPFMAFRRAVPGSATGAHIHIGYPSHRIR